MVQTNNRTKKKNGFIQLVLSFEISVVPEGGISQGTILGFSLVGIIMFVQGES